MSLTSINDNNFFRQDVIGNVRKAQEDSNDFATTPNGDVFIVCDGMGGHVGGKQASSIAVKCIIEYLNKEAYDNIQAALREALEFANEQILFHAAAHPELRGMGTTACILLLKDNVAYVAHIGDSRIYLYLGKEQQLHRVTKDHSYVQAQVDCGALKADDAENHKDKNIILRALGIKKNISPTINTVYPKNDDIFLICSDGLSDMLSDKDIRAIFLSNAPISVTGESLIEQALHAGGLDNITTHLIRITNSNAYESIFNSFTPELKDPINPIGAKPDNNIVSSNDNTNKRSKTLLFSLVAAALLAIVCITAVILFTGKDEPGETMEDKIEQLNKELDKLNTEKTEIENSLNADEIFEELHEKYKNEQASNSTNSKPIDRIVSENVKNINKQDNLTKEDENLIVRNVFGVVGIDFDNNSVEKFKEFAKKIKGLNDIAAEIKEKEAEIEEYKQLSNNYNAKPSDITDDMLEGRNNDTEKKTKKGHNREKSDVTNTNGTYSV